MEVKCKKISYTYQNRKFGENLDCKILNNSYRAFVNIKMLLCIIKITVH